VQLLCDGVYLCACVGTPLSLAAQGLLPAAAASADKRRARALACAALGLGARAARARRRFARCSDCGQTRRLGTCALLCGNERADVVGCNIFSGRVYSVFYRVPPFVFVLAAAASEAHKLIPG
jgi:hypothetical protein